MAHYDATRNAWRITADATRPGEKRRRVVPRARPRQRHRRAPRHRTAEYRLRDEVAADLDAPEAGTFAAAALAWQHRARSPPRSVVALDAAPSPSTCPAISSRRSGRASSTR